MPKELDPLPEEAEEEKLPPANKVLESSSQTATSRGRRGPLDRPQTGRVSFDDYLKLVEDRPIKFTAEQVGYRKATEVGVQCDRCWHFYKQVAGDQRTVCEILRLDNEESIDPEYVCQFMTRDGKQYPYQKKVSRNPNAEED